MYSKEIPLFENSILKTLPPQLILDYMANGKFVKKNFQKNEMIHLEGDLCKQVEIIMDGEISVERIGASGDLLTVNVFYPNEMIGSNLLFSTSNKYPMTITAKQPSKVIIIEKDTLFELCSTYEAFLLYYLQSISDISVLISNKVKNRVSRTIKASIITYLNKQYSLQHSYCIQLTMKKKDLAERFGISRTSLSRELQKMKNSGLIDYDATSITILDPTIVQI